MTSISLSYDGGLASNHTIDLYDVARGLAGFQRSLALTTHLALHGEVITQAPSMKGAEILVSTAESGSWKSHAKIVFSAGTLAVVGGAMVAPRDTFGGHIVFSMYDYVVNSTLGFDVNYDESLRKQHENYLEERKITPEKLDSLIEKTETSIKDIHRPIIGSETAHFAKLICNTETGPEKQLGPLFSAETYEHLLAGTTEDFDTTISGKVSSFNLNTNKGRIYVFDEKRPIPFELNPECRTIKNTVAITTSLRQNAIDRSGRNGAVSLVGKRQLSANGRLKSILAEEINEQE